MSQPIKFASVHSAFQDLVNRTLSSIPCDLARLIYLASTRDYNSGTYHHDGLAARFGPEAARVALQAAHRDIFLRLVALPLEGLVEELEIYVLKSHENTAKFLHAWQELEPYRVAIPIDMEQTVVQLFLSNIRIALEVLHFRQKKTAASLSIAWPRKSPGQ